MPVESTRDSLTLPALATCVATAALLLSAALTYDLRWTAVALAASAVAAYALAGKSRLAVLSPIVVVVGFGVLYGLPFVLTVAAGGVLIDERAYAIRAIPRASWLHALCVTALLFGCLLARSWPRRVQTTERVARARRIWPAEFLLPVAVLLGVLGLLATARFFMASGGAAAVQEATYAGRGLAMRGQGLWLIGLDLIGLAGLVIYYDSLTRGRRLRARVVVLSVLTFLFLWLLFIGSRGALLRFAVAVVAVRSVAGLSITRRQAIAGGTVLLFATLAHSWVGRDLSLLTRVDWRAVPYFTLNPANGEFGSVVPTLADVVAEVPRSHDYRWGATYVEALGVIVPRAVWPSRPFAPGEWYAARFYSEVWESGGGYGFSPVAEAYLNYGIAGVLLLAMLLGALLFWIEQAVLAAAAPSPKAILFALAIPWLAFSWRLDAASVIKNYAVLNVAPFGLLLLTALLARGMAVQELRRRRLAVVRANAHA